jgi:hypothetical protein
LGGFGGAGGPCVGNFHPATPSAWQWLYQSPRTDYMGKTFYLFSSTSAASDLGSNDCGGSGKPGVPTPGDISVCAHANCSPAGIASHLPVKSNFLYVLDPAHTGNYSAGYPQYFLGLRGSLNIADTASLRIPAGTGVLILFAAMFAGDNGVTSESAALAYTSEYRTPPAFNMTGGTAQGFGYQAGAFRLTAVANAVDFTAAGALHYPVFDISSWVGPAPPVIALGGAILHRDTDYLVAITGGHLLIQVMRVTSSGTRFTIGRPIPTPRAPRQVPGRDTRQ